MGLTQPPAYQYSPVNLPSPEASAEEGGLTIHEPTTPEDREWNLKLWRAEREEELKRMALRQAYIWGMTATVGGTILGIIFLATKYG